MKRKYRLLKIMYNSSGEKVFLSYHRTKKLAKLEAIRFVRSSRRKTLKAVCQNKRNDNWVKFYALKNF